MSEEKLEEMAREWAARNEWGMGYMEPFKAGYRAQAAYVARLEAALSAIRETVDAQAEDEALWAVPALGTQPIAEAYLQQELRNLHTVIETAMDALDAGGDG